MDLCAWCFGFNTIIYMIDNYYHKIYCNDCKIITSTNIDAYRSRRMYN